MLFIRLHNLQFHACHGIYEQEAHVENEFEVNITIAYQPVADIVTNLEDTIDYTAVYRLVKLHMHKPVQLLETLAMTITEQILKEFHWAHKVDVAVRKLHPIIRNFTGSVEVEFSKTRKSNV